MTGLSKRIDLVVLVADKNQEATIRALLQNRCASLAIRQVRFAIQVHPRRDPGVLREAADFLRTYADLAEHALVVFDRVGAGQKVRSASDLATDLGERLSKSGWDDRAVTVVIDPELEAWVWSDSPHVSEILGWTEEPVKLQEWLTSRALWNKGEPKPGDPKAALEAVLREVRLPRSSAIYAELATKVSFRRCADPAFRKLTATLADWFGLPDATPRQPTDSPGCS